MQERRLSNCQLQLCAVGVHEDFEIVDVGDALDDAFGQRKAHRERFEIEWGRHHDRVRNAVEDERDREFLDDTIHDGRRQASPAANDRARNASCMFGG